MGRGERAPNGTVLASGSSLISGLPGLFVGSNGDLYLVGSYNNDVVRLPFNANPATQYLANAAGHYTVVASTFSGCTASASHNVNASPQVNGKTAALVCGGGQVTLTATNG